MTPLTSCTLLMSSRFIICPHFYHIPSFNRPLTTRSTIANLSAHTNKFTKPNFLSQMVSGMVRVTLIGVNLQVR